MILQPVRIPHKTECKVSHIVSTVGPRAEWRKFLADGKTFALACEVGK